jgi:mRNA-degrading endonuclease toxin of MazEF toxin-antitoxin module
VRRFDVYLVNLDPTQGHEIQKTRPGLIISPDEMNRHIGTVIIAPMTTKGQAYPDACASLVPEENWANCARPDPHRRQTSSDTATRQN